MGPVSGCCDPSLSARAARTERGWQVGYPRAYVARQDSPLGSFSTSVGEKNPGEW